MFFEHDECDLRRELEHHIELLTLDYAQRGVPAREARRHALIAFGGLEQVKEQCRDIRNAFAARAILRAGWASVRECVPLVASKSSRHD